MTVAIVYCNRSSVCVMMRDGESGLLDISHVHTQEQLVQVVKHRKLAIH